MSRLLCGRHGHVQVKNSHEGILPCCRSEAATHTWPNRHRIQRFGIEGSVKP